MNSEWLGGLRGRALALGATLLLTAVVWLAAVQPLLDWHGERAVQLQERRALAARMQRLASTLPDLKREAEAGASGKLTAGAMLSGGSDSVAGAVLQERVQAMATAAGDTLTSVETLPADQAGSWRRIGLHISLTAPWPNMIRLLQALDEATPRMLVDDLHVHSTLLVSRPVTLPLQTSFTVYAFRAGTAPESARP
jgi:general secretion pathway protein M